MEFSINPPGWRILLVEDHPDTRCALESWLGRKGHMVFAADCMMSALTILEHNTGIELMISDIGLPDGNGWELLRRISGNRTSCFPAIAMSGYGTFEDRSKSREAGFVAHLVKPFRLAELSAAISDLELAHKLPS